MPGAALASFPTSNPSDAFAGAVQKLHERLAKCLRIVTAAAKFRLRNLG
jgi:hypothetical protein